MIQGYIHLLIHVKIPMKCRVKLFRGLNMIVSSLIDFDVGFPHKPIFSSSKYATPSPLYTTQLDASNFDTHVFSL